MLTYVIEGIPVPWAAHQGYGRKAYNPRSKEKEFVQWQLRTQNNRSSPMRGPVRLLFYFHVPIPGRTSSVRKKQMLNGVIHPITRPDLNECIEFNIECLKGIIIEDRLQVVDVSAKKIYSEKPQTIIQMEILN